MFSTAFPDYDNGPEFARAASVLAKYGFTDNSYKNDACPSLYAVTDETREIGVSVYIEYANPALREGGPRMALYSVVWHETEESRECDSLEQVENYLLCEGVEIPDSARMASAIAARYANELRAVLDYYEKRAIREGHAVPNDFCDANTNLAESFEKEYGRAPLESGDGSPAHDRDCHILNLAQSIAHRLI